MARSSSLANSNIVIQEIFECLTDNPSECPGRYYSEELGLLVICKGRQHLYQGHAPSSLTGSSEARLPFYEESAEPKSELPTLLDSRNNYHRLQPQSEEVGFYHDDCK